MSHLSSFEDERYSTSHEAMIFSVKLIFNAKWNTCLFIKLKGQHVIFCIFRYTVIKMVFSSDIMSMAWHAVSVCWHRAVYKDKVAVPSCLCFFMWIFAPFPPTGTAPFSNEMVESGTNRNITLAKVNKLSISMSGPTSYTSIVTQHCSCSISRWFWLHIQK